MKIFQYRTERIPKNYPLDQACNRAGKKGWQFVSRESYFKDYRYLFVKETERTEDVIHDLSNHSNNSVSHSAASTPPKRLTCICKSDGWEPHSHCIKIHKGDIFSKCCHCDCEVKPI